MLADPVDSVVPAVSVVGAAVVTATPAATGALVVAPPLAATLAAAAEVVLAVAVLGPGAAVVAAAASFAAAAPAVVVAVPELAAAAAGVVWEDRVKDARLGGRMGVKMHALPRDKLGIKGSSVRGRKHVAKAMRAGRVDLELTNYFWKGWFGPGC